MGVFTAREAAAFAPPEKLLPSEWADKYRFLTGDITPEPGPFRIDRTPYIRGMMDAVIEPAVREIVFKKSAQLGFSLLLQNLLGWIVCQDPGPVMFTLPHEPDCDKLITEQLKPLIEACPTLAAQLPGNRDDVTAKGIRFLSAPVYFAYSTSAQTMASRYVRYAYLDEVDKMALTTGSEGDAISLTRARIRNAGHRGRLIIGCTPTTPEGHISRAYDACGDHRFYLVPCPTCSHYQRLAFGNLRFDFADVVKIEDRAKRADYIKDQRRALYECEKCKALITSEQRGGMLSRGVWVSTGQTVADDGTLVGDRPRASRVGFALSSLYSPWVPFGELAAQFVSVEKDRSKLKEFRNQWLGETWDEVLTSVTVEDLRGNLREAPEAGIVPAWASVLIATVDTQEHGFYYTLRAWGRDRSQLVHYGELHSLDAIRETCLNTPYNIDGTDESLRACLMFVDSGGHRTNEIYHFAQTDNRIRAIKGASSFTPAQQMSWTTPAKEIGLTLGILDTQFFKDELDSVRRSGKWLLNDEVSETYLRHLAAESKRLDSKTGRYVWKEVTSGAANHYLDCEVYQIAAAQFLQTRALPDEATVKKYRDDAKKQREAVKAPPSPYQPSETTKWLTNKTNWIK
jgi:phage terminase large subunit GpA-like protein